MPFQKVEYTFPDGQEEEVNTDIEVEDSGAIEVDISGNAPEPEAKVEEEVVEEDLDIEVVDDTPKADRNRKPSEPPTDVTDEELERATQMLELDLREEKQDSQRRIAWVAMSSMVLYSLLPLMPFVPEARLSTLSSLSDMLFLSQASIIGLYFGATAYMSRKP